MPTNDHLSLTHVFKSLNQVVFRRWSATEFSLITPQPDWLGQLCTGRDFPSDSSIDLTILFPFLGDFLEEAEDFWESGYDAKHQSESWVEQLDDQQIPLEATALRSDGHPVLVIKKLGNKFDVDVSLIRRHREKDQDLKEKTNLTLHLESEKKEREEQIALQLLNAADHRDSETSAHVKRIGLYAEAMAKALGWSDAEANDIRIAAPMHDIGKISTPDAVLLKPGKLTAEEFEIMKQHAAAGADILSGSHIDMLNMASEIALCHHERWDGNGYPNGLIGEAIPVAARITSIVDVFDALLHKRVYKAAFSLDETIATMNDMVGKNFDPVLYGVFLENLPKMLEIAELITE